MAEDVKDDEVKPDDRAPEVKPSDEAKKNIVVDWEGEKLELPVDMAKRIIAKRDNTTKIHRELSAKVSEYEVKLTEANRRAEAIESMRKGDIEQAEALMTQKINEKFSRLKNKVVDAELQSQLLANPAFLDTPSNRQDALALIKSSHQFDIDENDNSVKAGDKTVADIVKDFVDTRDAFKKASGSTNKARPAPVTAPKQKPTLEQGLGKWMERNNMG